MAAYPISCTVYHAGGPTHKASIAKLVDVGFIMRSETKYLYRVKDIYDFEFTVTTALGDKKDIRCQGVIMKTYDSFEMIKGTKEKYLLVEVHFKTLSDTGRAAISSFLSLSPK